MSTDKNYEVLYIDIESKNALSVLEPLAKQHSIHLLPTTSIDEGIRLLETYHPILDAVILSSELAGASHLIGGPIPTIKAKGNDIPVLVLPSRDPGNPTTGENEQRAIDGSILPVDFEADPQQVFSRIQAVIESRHLTTRSSNSSAIESRWDNRHGLYLLRKNNGEYDGMFGFRLESIVAPRSQREAVIAVRAAIQWHHHFLSLLTLFPFPLNVTLRLISPKVEDQKNKKLLVSLIFSASGDSYELAADNAKAIYDETEANFNQSDDGLSSVYRFVPILRQLEFEPIITPFPPQSVVNLERRTIKFRNPGYGVLKNAVDDDASTPLTLPVAGSFSAPSFLDHTCSVLLDQSRQTLLDIAIAPAKLLTEEIDLLHDMTTGLSQDSEDSQLGEKESTITFAKALMEQAGYSFYLQSRLATSGPAISKNLVAAASIDLFGQVSNVQVAHLNSHDGGVLNRISSQATQPIVRLQHIFPLSYLVTMFHLPLPFQGDAPWIDTIHPVDRFLPEDISTNGPVLGYKQVGESQQLVRIASEDLVAISGFSVRLVRANQQCFCP